MQADPCDVFFFLRSAESSIIYATMLFADLEVPVDHDECTVVNLVDVFRSISTHSRGCVPHQSCTEHLQSQKYGDLLHRLLSECTKSSSSFSSTCFYTSRVSNFRDSDAFQNVSNGYRYLCTLGEVHSCLENGSSSVSLQLVSLPQVNCQSLQDWFPRDKVAFVDVFVVEVRVSSSSLQSVISEEKGKEVVLSQTSIAPQLYMAVVLQPRQRKDFVRSNTGVYERLQFERRAEASTSAQAVRAGHYAFHSTTPAQPYQVLGLAASYPFPASMPGPAQALATGGYNIAQTHSAEGYPDTNHYSPEARLNPELSAAQSNGYCTSSDASWALGYSSTAAESYSNHNTHPSNRSDELYTSVQSITAEHAHRAYAHQTTAAISSYTQQTAVVDAVYAQQTAVDPVYAQQTTVDPVYAQQTTVDPIYAQQTTVDPVYAQQTTVDPVYAQQTAVDTVYVQQTATDPVYAQQTTVEAAYAQQAAVDTVYTQQTTVDAAYAQQAPVHTAYAHEFTAEQAYAHQTATTADNAYAQDFTAEQI
ncbi:hypothetical protein VKT23_014840 [Stygiomarasmius scandens]|uniref:Uncharacterized protein n=1 Tax=Marasmiellus scandens TaxID=2682957 RepID=A0ABR1J237_9AGAR